VSGAPRPGVQGYSAEAPELLQVYENVRFEAAHRHVLDLVPAAPISVLDIGAGTGRDAAWFAARGDHVTAIEPTREMRDGAMALHPAPNIAWLDDGLPLLESVRGESFDLVWLSAVWMHLDTDERAAAFPRVAALVAPAGALMITLRHGPIPTGRRMFEVGADELVAQAAPCGLSIVRVLEAESDRRPGITWSRLWFARTSGGRALT
jgi:SAM-dependent methyltransferase